MVDPDTAVRLIGVAAVESDDGPQVSNPAPTVPTPTPTTTTATAPVSTTDTTITATAPVSTTDTTTTATAPVSTTSFSENVQSLVDKLVKSNPAFADLQTKVDTILSEKGYIEQLIASTTDDPVVANNVRDALGRIGVTNSILEELPRNYYVKITAQPISAAERIRKLNPTITIRKEANNTITIHWGYSDITPDNTYKEITNRSVEDVRTVAAVLSDNKTDVAMGPLGTMGKFMKDTNVPSELRDAMESTLRKMGVTGKKLYDMNNNTYITFKYDNPSTDPSMRFLTNISIYIVKSNNTFQRVNKLPESKQTKPVFVVTNTSSSTSPIGTHNVSIHLLKLFDFLHKQSMSTSTSRSRIPHIPAKKTKRRRHSRHH